MLQPILAQFRCAEAQPRRLRGDPRTCRFPANRDQLRGLLLRSTADHPPSPRRWKNVFHLREILCTVGGVSLGGRLGFAATANHGRRQNAHEQRNDEQPENSHSILPMLQRTTQVDTGIRARRKDRGLARTVPFAPALSAPHRLKDQYSVTVCPSAMAFNFAQMCHATVCEKNRVEPSASPTMAPPG